MRIPVARRVPEPGPATLCVSSQVGCRMGCVFCESGRLGFARDLRPEEIVGQYAAARLTLGWDIGQIVFMGMGEPLDNFDGLAGALAILLDGSGPAFSQDDITVCTIGLPEGITRLRDLGLKRLNLSVSLNAPDERLRGELMPASRGVGLEALAAALALYPQRRNFALAVNYCLIPDRNDGEGAAEGVADFLGRRRRPGGLSSTSFPIIPAPLPSVAPRPKPRSDHSPGASKRRAHWSSCAAPGAALLWRPAASSGASTSFDRAGDRSNAPRASSERASGSYSVFEGNGLDDTV